jgi:hypothetical protein
MDEQWPKEGMPSLEEVQRWQQQMHECLRACIEYVQTADGLDHVLRIAEAERHYERLGLL